LNKLNRRLDFFLEGANPDDAKVFREEYFIKKALLQEKIAKCMVQVSNLEKQREEVVEQGFDLKQIASIAKEANDESHAQNYMQLRNSYRALFREVTVNKEDEGGFRDIKFILRDGSGLLFCGPCGGRLSALLTGGRFLH
jgi:hypothetical protein